MRRHRFTWIVAVVGVVLVGAPALTGCTSSTGGDGVASGSPAALPGSSSPLMLSTPASVPTSVSPSRTPSPTASSSHSTARPSPTRSTTQATAPPVIAGTAPSGDGPLVVLDPGHNGGSGQAAEDNKPVPAGYGKTKPCNTTGTSTNAGYPEHAFTWDVANRVRAILTAHGVRVLMTRTSDDGIGPCVNVRAAIESTPGVAAAVAIHADGGPSGGHGFHICEDSRTPVGASSATVARSQTLSKDLRTSLEDGSGLTRSTYIGGGTAFYPRDDLTGLNLSTNPTTFLELGNMRNSGDASLQSSASGRARIAAAVAAGILDYLGL